MDRLSLLLDLSRVLRVDVEALLGRPWQYAPNGGADADELAPVRRHFKSYVDLIGALATELPLLPKLRAQAATAHSTYQEARYGQVIKQLPPLLASVDLLRRDTSARAHREALLVYVSAYAAAAKLLTKLGATDLAMLAADRSANGSVEAESLSARGMAAYQVVCALLRADRTDEAENLAVTMAEQVEAQARSDEPTLVSVAGALWLVAAVIAARRTERFEAAARLDRASALADMLGHDANHAWTAFGPTNVAIHRVSVAAELGDPNEALQAATAVDTANLPEGLRSRRAQMHLDLAWAQAQRKRDAEAVLMLLEAERTAPEAVHYNVVVRELMREMLARQHRTPTRALHDLAVRAGVLD